MTSEHGKHEPTEAEIEAALRVEPTEADKRRAEVLKPLVVGDNEWSRLYAICRPVPGAFGDLRTLRYAEVAKDAEIAELHELLADAVAALEVGIATLKDIQRFQGGLIAQHGDGLDVMLKALAQIAGRLGHMDVGREGEG